MTEAEALQDIAGELFKIQRVLSAMGALATLVVTIRTLMGLFRWVEK